MEIRIFENKIVCPRCDGNGLFYKARIIEMDLIVYIYDDCEDYEEMKSNKLIDLSYFLKTNNLHYASADIELRYCIPQ